MIDWIIVLALVIGGIGLVIVEILFVPGTTIVGILGLVSLIFGVYLSFDYFGTTIGWWVVAGSSIAFVASIYAAFKGNTWERFALKDAISSKVNEGYTSKLQIAERGKALSALRPIGKAEFGTTTYEVRTFGDYIDSGELIEIVKIDKNNIYVQPVKKS